MLEVEVHNFQSIVREVIKVEGFTALVGRSNIGKSAIVRAVRSALTGAPVDDNVRHNPATCARILKGNQKCKCSCMVRIKASNFDLEWEKGDAVNRYNYKPEGQEAQEYTVVGRGTPEFLQPEFLPVEIGDSKDLIQISDQFDPLFLLNQRGTVVADVLSDVARLDDINKAMALVEKDRKSKISARKVREKDAATLTGKLATFEGLDDTVKQVREVEDQEREVAKADAKAAMLHHYQTSVWSLARHVRALERVKTIETPDNSELSVKSAKFDRLDLLTESVEVRQEEVELLSGVREIKLPDATPFIEQIAVVNRLGGWLEQFRNFKLVLARLKGVGDVEITDFKGLYEAYERWDSTITLQNRLAKSQGRIEELAEELRKVEQEVLIIEDEADELGVCPTCKQPVLDGKVHLGAV